jgi:hypothetical protein
LPESDERLLLLETLAVRAGQFVPGGTTRQAIATFMGSSPEACTTFLSTLTRSARDDALARARAHGLLPPWRPR